MSKEQKLKHTIYTVARQISREVATEFSMEFDTDALDLIAELIWKQLNLYSTDLEAFQKHAKRSTINTDDIKLLVRRNEALKELLEIKLQTIQTNKPPTSEQNCSNNNNNSSSTKRKRK